MIYWKCKKRSHADSLCALDACYTDKYIFIVGYLGAMEYLAGFVFMHYFTQCVFILNVTLNASAGVQSIHIVHVCGIEAVFKVLLCFNIHILSLLNK